MALISTIQAPQFRHRLALTSLIMIMIGLFVSRAMISLGVALIGLQFFLKPDIAQSFRNFYKNKLVFALSILFFVYLFTGLYSENSTKFLERMSIKLPLLLMPLGFSTLEDMPKNYLKNTLYFFIFFSFITCLISFGMYLLDYEKITESYKYAKVIPNIFGVSHTRLSLMLAITVFVSFYLYQEKHFLLSKKETYFIAFIGLFVMAFLHLLSVRSGLLAFYLASFVLVALYTFQQKRYILGASLFLTLTILPVIVYYTVPTVKNKISYMAIDVKRFIDGESVNHYSDGNRLLSIKIGLEIGNANPIFGIGVGDLEKAMFSTYEKNYPDIAPEVRLTPHNQFVYVYAAAGFIGVIIFLIASLYPFSRKYVYDNKLFICIYVIMFSSFLSEATIENQLGTAIFASFYLIGWYCHPTNHKTQHS